MWYRDMDERMDCSSLRNGKVCLTLALPIPKSKEYTIEKGSSTLYLVVEHGGAWKCLRLPSASSGKKQLLLREEVLIMRLALLVLPLFYTNGERMTSLSCPLIHHRTRPLHMTHDTSHSGPGGAPHMYQGCVMLGRR